MNTQTIKEQLTRLKLGFSASNLEEILAKNKRAMSLEWLSELLERERFMNPFVKRRRVVS